MTMVRPGRAVSKSTFSPVFSTTVLWVDRLSGAAGLLYFTPGLRAKRETPPTNGKDLDVLEKELTNYRRPRFSWYMGSGCVDDWHGVG